MTFGNYIHQLLLDKKVNIHQLVEDAGIKNRTEIYRMFDNKCSYEKTEELMKKIMPFLKPDEEEINTLQKLMHEIKNDTNSKKSNQILEQLYLDSNLKPNHHFDKIKSFLRSNKNNKIEIYIGYETNREFSTFLDDFLYRAAEYDISVIHAVNFNKSDEVVAAELFTIIKLLAHDEYSCYEVSRVDTDGVVILADSGKKCRLMVLTNDDMLVKSDVSREFYDYLIEKYRAARKGKPVKNIYDRVTNLINTVTELSPYETNNSFSLEGVFCFGDVPMDIKHSMLEDSNFFGFPPDSKYIKDLVEATGKRYENKLKSGVTHTYVMSEERITELFKTGKTIDHVREFRPLTKDELISMLKIYTENNNKFKYRFFKSGYLNKCIEFAWVENFGIILWDAFEGYGKKHFKAVISHPRVIRVTKNFVKYFWKNCTLSDEESKVKLDELVKKYL